MQASGPPEPSKIVNSEPVRSSALLWWLRGLGVVALAALSALAYGGPLTGGTLVAWIVFAVLFVVLMAASVALGPRQMSLRGGRPSALGIIVILAMIIAWNVVAKVLESDTTPGAVASYVLQFVSAAVIFGVGMTVLFRMSSQPTKLE